jgi:hypothetical protein
VIDPVSRAHRWALFYNEEGGLKDILEALRLTYLDRMSAVEPWETDKLMKLAIASKVTMAVDDEVRSIIQAGAIVGERREHTKRIEALPTAKRRWL